MPEDKMERLARRGLQVLVRAACVAMTELCMACKTGGGDFAD